MPPLPSPRQDHACAFLADGNRVIVAGDDPATAETVILDATTGQWSAGPPLPQPRSAARLVRHGDQLLLLGGVTDGDYPREVYALSSDESEWTEVAVRLDRGRSDFVAVSIDNEGDFFCS